MICKIQYVVIHFFQIPLLECHSELCHSIFGWEIPQSEW